MFLSLLECANHGQYMYMYMLNIFILLPVLINLFSVDYVHQLKRSITMKDLVDFLGRK